MLLIMISNLRYSVLNLCTLIYIGQAHKQLSIKRTIIIYASAVVNIIFLQRYSHFRDGVSVLGHVESLKCLALSRPLNFLGITIKMNSGPLWRKG